MPQCACAHCLKHHPARRQRDTIQAWQASTVCKHVLLAVSHSGVTLDVALLEAGIQAYCHGKKSLRAPVTVSTSSKQHEALPKS